MARPSSATLHTARSGTEFWITRLWKDAPQDGRPVFTLDEVKRLQRPKAHPEVLEAVCRVKTVFPGAVVTQHMKRRKKRTVVPLRLKAMWNAQGED